MIDWAQITGFEWDDGNARKITEKHAVRQSEAEQVFFNQPLLVVPDSKHSQDEPRYHALGVTDDLRGLHTIFTLRGAGSLIRVISVRNMNRKERKVYGQSQEDT